MSRLRFSTLFLALGLALGGLPAHAENARTLARQGNDFYKDQRFDDAIDSYRKALEITPTDPAIQYNLGTALEGKKSHEEAQKVLEQAAQTPDTGKKRDAWYNLGISLYDQLKDSAAKGGPPRVVTPASPSGQQPGAAQPAAPPSPAQVKEEGLKKSLDAFRHAILTDPKDEDAKYNYEVVQQMLKDLKNQQQSGQGQNSDKQDKGQQDKDQQGKGQQNQSQGKDQNKDQDKQQQGQGQGQAQPDKQDKQGQQNPGQQQNQQGQDQQGQNPQDQGQQGQNKPGQDQQDQQNKDQQDQQNKDQQDKSKDSSGSPQQDPKDQQQPKQDQGMEGSKPDQDQNKPDDKNPQQDKQQEPQQQQQSQAGQSGGAQQDKPQGASGGGSATQADKAPTPEQKEAMRLLNLVEGANPEQFKRMFQFRAKDNKKLEKDW